MMIEIGWVLFAVVCMSLLTAGLGAVFPPSYRPWWHALRRAAPIGQASAAAAAAQIDPYQAETEPVPLPSRPFEVVHSVDRRGQSLQFVGKDRRKAGRAQAHHDARRRGNGH
jgi:hypothetical protein